MGKEPSSTASHSVDDTTRRRLLTVMGAGGAAALATLVSSKEAQAGHDSTNVCHLGEFNDTPDTDTQGATFITGEATAFVLDINNTGTVDGGSGGIQASSRRAPGIQGNAIDPGIAGVYGQSSASEDAEGFEKGSGSGVKGVSGTGAGVLGHSESGPGGQFSSNSSTALQVTANVEGAEGHAGLRVENTHSFGTGVSAHVQGGTGVFGEAVGSDDDPGIGVRGSAGGGIGVLGLIPHFGDGVALQGITTADDGTPTLNGAALQVVGRARFSTGGSAVVPTGQTSVFVGNGAVTPDSHISVTLVNDPGSRSVHWVERDDGNGFTVHMSSAPPNKRPETFLTYLITEPA
jgi:hypothetical protein